MHARAGVTDLMLIAVSKSPTGSVEAKSSAVVPLIGSLLAAQSLSLMTCEHAIRKRVRGAEAA
jgi:hypothetical protein